MKRYTFYGMNFDIAGGEEAGAELTCGRRGPDRMDLEFTVRLNEGKFPQKTSVRFKAPCRDVFSAWNPTCRFSRLVPPNWAPAVSASRAASGAPVLALIGKSGRNRLTIAVSDASTPMKITAGFCEEDGCADCAVEFFTETTGKRDRYRAVIRLDARDAAFYDCIGDVRKWWAAEGGYRSAFVPETARLPVYSAWYSFHQRIDVDGIAEQCRLAKELGCESLIVDDGWQTDDSARGYAFCGDWKVCPAKIPDMKAFVKRIHGLGMKFLLWYSVPFVGRHSKAWDRFEGKFLEEQKGQNVRVLDPRFREVRDYLTDLYETAVREWDLDGFKLDFIDSFRLTPQSSFAPDDGRDFDSLEDAVEELLRQALAKIRAVKPDACIEFRQGYIGPLMQGYGNMLRVGDCPGDALSNRVGSLDLRLTSGTTAVHSDMLTWNGGDSAESAAMQLIAALYCVPQISVRIDALPQSHREMLRFYLKFWRDNRDVLLDGRLKLFGPEANYSLATAEKDGRMIATAYSDPVLRLGDPPPESVVFVNGTGDTRLLVQCAGSFGPRKYRVLDCRGNTAAEGRAELDEGVRVFDVPVSGMVVLGGR